jgi:hypothetical protein
VILKLFLWVVSALFDLCDISRGKFTNFWEKRFIHAKCRKSEELNALHW